MKMQEYDPRVVSVTQVRRDIDTLKRVLAEREEALVMRGQSLLFVAVSPRRYQELKKGNDDVEQINTAVALMDKMRKKYGRSKGKPAADYVIRMRDERVRRWKKS